MDGPSDAGNEVEEQMSYGDMEKQLNTEVIRDGEKQIEDLRVAQGRTLRELQKESLRIEENVLIAQKRVHFERLEIQKKLEQNLEASQMVEKLYKQRTELETAQKIDEKDRKERKSFKLQILELFDIIKMKTLECKTFVEARDKAKSLRVMLLEKRESFQETAKNLEEKERLERIELQESHERSAKSLKVWQDLQVRHVSGEKKEGLLRVNRIKAQQLREIQRKESEQLREIQHIKAKFKLAEFDAELEFMSFLESKKAEQLLFSNQMYAKHKTERRQLKREIIRLREASKKANRIELNEMRAKQLKAIEENRSKELLDFQKREGKRRKDTFEQEIKLMDAEMKELLENNEFDLNTYVSHSSGSKSSMSGGAGTGTATTSNKSEDSHNTQESEASLSGEHADVSNAEEKLLEEDEEERKKKLERMREEANTALALAQSQMVELEERHALAIKTQNIADEEAVKSLSDAYTEKRSMMRRMNESEIVELLKEHSQEKIDIQSAHARELKSLQSALDLESQLHMKSLHKSQVASQAKSEFLSFVCHELRNPLSAIVAVVDMLLNNNILDNHTQDHIQTVKQESELMCAIVNDVLDFAKIEARMLLLDPVNFNVHQLLEDLVKEQQLSAKKTRPNVLVKCIIEKNVPMLVNSDPVRIRQVLLNLVSNAVKFTLQGSITVSLKVEKIKKSSEMHLEFSVRDTGVGIAESDLEHIFAAFSQAKPSITREFGGTGLGLSISKSLVERLGGQISVESQKGKGTCFMFTVKVRIVSEEEALEEQTTSRHVDESMFPQNLDVLIVEDSATLRRLWSKLLLEQGCQIQTAQNGQEALEKCSQKDYDVVLMDITMPIMSGDIAVKKLREQGWKGVVIALTANAMESDRKNYIAAGMDAVLTKPCKMDNLKATVVQQLRRRNSDLLL